MATKIAVLGGKGGVGKTTVTANLSYALAGKSLRVAAVDLDTGLNCLNRAFRNPKPLFYLNDVLTGRCRIRQALVQSETRQSCYVLSVKENTDPPAQNIRALFTQMEQMFDYILVDSPPGWGEDAERAFKCCDHAVVVFTPHPNSVRGAAAVIEALKPYDYLKIYSLLNMVRGDLVKSGAIPTPFELFNMLKVSPLGLVPDSDAFGFSPVASSEIFDIAANNLHNGRSDIFDCVKQYSGFFGKLKSKMKRNA
ncbi:MAG: AAA family ATPase [Christensenellales bacterium]|nr:AAA family ATPase [Clostridia bacterium]